MSIQTKNLILRIDNYKLIASNLELIKNQPSSFISSDTASGNTTLNVGNSNGIVANDYVLIESFGNQLAEIRKVQSVTTSTIVITVATSFDHLTGCRVTKIPYNQIEFSRATTETGSKSVLGSVISINPNLEYTEYNDTTNTTGFGFFRFKNETTGIFSEYSGSTPYSGNYLDSVEQIAQDALDKVDEPLGSKNATKRQIISDINEALIKIGQRTNWNFEINTDETTQVSTNDIDFDISALNLKYNYTTQGIFSVLFGTKPLNSTSIEEMDKIYADKPVSPLTTTANIGDTSIVISNSYEFADSGTIFVGSNQVIFTSNDTVTGTLSGIPVSGTGSIQTQVLAGTNVWEFISPGEPNKYTILNDIIRLDKPVDDGLNGYTLKIRYLMKLNTVTGFHERVTVPFYNIISDYIAYKVEMRRKNSDFAASYFQQFSDGLEAAVSLYQIPLQDIYRYWKSRAVISSNRRTIKTLTNNQNG